jgi:hypothetical protein
LLTARPRRIRIGPQGGVLESKFLKSPPVCSHRSEPTRRAGRVACSRAPAPPAICFAKNPSVSLEITPFTGRRNPSLLSLHPTPIYPSAAVALTPCSPSSPRRRHAHAPPLHAAARTPLFPTRLRSSPLSPPSAATLPHPGRPSSPNSCAAAGRSSSSGPWLSPGGTLWGDATARRLLRGRAAATPAGETAVGVVGPLLS